MKCIVCNTEFEAKRADAKFCSSTCRSKASRNGIVGEADTNPENAIVSLPPEISKKEKSHCTQCQTFESGIHWCPNKECGCWQTKEEQEKDIEEHQKQCSHPVSEQLYSRCMVCMAMLSYKRIDTKPLLKGKKDDKKK